MFAIVTGTRSASPRQGKDRWFHAAFVQLFGLYTRKVSVGAASLREDVNDRVAMRAPKVRMDANPGLARECDQWLRWTGN